MKNSERIAILEARVTQLEMQLAALQHVGPWYSRPEPIIPYYIKEGTGCPPTRWDGSFITTCDSPGGLTGNISGHCTDAMSQTLEGYLR